MARLLQSGIELNSLTSGFDFDSSSGSGDSIVTTTVRTGTYAYRVVLTSNEGYATYSTRATGANDHLFVRFYFRLASAVNAQITLLTMEETLGVIRGGIRLNTDNTLELWNDSAQVGSDSAALSTNTWYRIELEIDSTTSAGSHVLDARIDGVSFASSSAQTLGTMLSAVIGGRDTPGNTSTGDMFFDDIAINNTSGSFENSWPGAGGIIFLRPSEAGDNADWTRGGSDSGANWSQVEEVTPDDGSSIVLSTTLNNIDDYNVGAPTAIGDTDTIKLIAVGLRYRGNSASNVPSFVVRVKASASGTVEESSNITPNSTSYQKNSNAVPRTPPLILYDLPGASTTAWTKADLDTAQIGYRISVDNTNQINITATWMEVEFTPVTATTSTSTTTSSSTSTSTTSTSSSTSTTTTSTSTTSTSSSTSTTTSTTTTSTSTSSSTSTTSTSTSTSTSTTTTSTSSSTSTSTSTTSTSSSTSTTTTSTSTTTSTTTTSTSTTTSSSTTTTSTSTSRTTSTSTTTTSTSSSTSITTTSTSSSTSTTTTSTSSSTITTSTSSSTTTSTSTTVSITTSTSTTSTSTSTTTTSTSTSRTTSTSTTSTSSSTSLTTSTSTTTTSTSSSTSTSTTTTSTSSSTSTTTTSTSTTVSITTSTSTTSTSTSSSSSSSTSTTITWEYKFSVQQGW